MDKNINRVKDLLITIKEKAKILEPMASDSQKQTLRKVDGFLNQITGFQQNVGYLKLLPYFTWSLIVSMIQQRAHNHN